MIKVIKKDKTIADFNKNKIKLACKKASDRIVANCQNYDTIVEDVIYHIEHDTSPNEFGDYYVTVEKIHNLVEQSLEKINLKVAQSYRDYRNYKQDYIKMMDEVYQEAEKISYIGDRDNANTDSTTIPTQRSLIYAKLSKELYKKFFLNNTERQAINDGYIYIHDLGSRRDSINCCLIDIENILNNGFEMANIWYNEPNSLDTAFDVIADIILNASSCQYGGMTMCEIDKILSKYAKKSYKRYLNDFANCNGFWDFSDMIKVYEIDTNQLNLEKLQSAERYAEQKVYRDFEQGFQGWEYKFNTVGSSRGDFPFIAMSFGLSNDKFSKMATKCILKVRMNGQGKNGFKRVVLFPKLQFLYDEELHGEGKPLEYLFNLAIECSKKACYPDYVSLTGEGYIPNMYKKYKRVISLMGCRASLSPYYEKGGFYPQDDNDKPIFVGRFNCGAISLNLPMIYQKAKIENNDFYSVLDYYLEMIRNLHKRTKDYLGNKKASTNPLMFMQGGAYGGTLKGDDKIAPLLETSTYSFGITALNELQILYNQKSIYEDGNFALEVMKYINKKIEIFKEEDHMLYAVYGTPAEKLCELQPNQFKTIYGNIKDVTDKPYFSNSFHCHVTEDITPIEKQDSEKRFWDLFNGGKIQYCRYPISYNTKYITTLVRRAMKFGFYEGVNLSLAYCEDCGYEQYEMEKCPKCNSENILKIDRICGYLGYTKVKGKSRVNDGKLAEINDRISM